MRRLSVARSTSFLPGVPVSTGVPGLGVWPPSLCAGVLLLLAYLARISARFRRRSARICSGSGSGSVSMTIGGSSSTVGVGGGGRAVAAGGWFE